MLRKFKDEILPTIIGLSALYGTMAGVMYLSVLPYIPA